MKINEMFVDEETKKLADEFASVEILALLAVLSTKRRGTREYNKKLRYFLMLSYRFGAIQMMNRVYDFKGFEGYKLFITEDIENQLREVMKAIRSLP
jgi:hypothetical protein